VAPTRLDRVPVAAGPAFIERIQRLPSKFTATLSHEAQNRFNPYAVAVHANGEKIGYLPADLSKRYLETVKSQPLECPGHRASMAAHEDTGVDVLLDLTGVPEPA
jgi:hypothetical protein